MNRNRKIRNGKRAVAGAMAAVMTAGAVGVCEYYHPGREVMAEEEAAEILEKTASEALIGTDAGESEDRTAKAGTFKEESVYVKADAGGRADKATVTEWIKNPENGEFLDVSGLKEIKNIKGEEEFVKGKGKDLKWRSEGNDIYYQGTTEEALPVDVNISYKLDGKPVKAEELSGKDGKVEIHIDYENHAKQSVEIGGEDVEMYTPFTMVTAMMLPTDEYTNVTVDNGKIMSDADKNIVIGLGFPGLTENLKLEDTDVDIPESITITADVKSASVGPTVTVASAELMSEFDLSDVEDFDSLEDSVRELEDASAKLADGTNEAADGSKALADGTKEAADGSKELAEGSEEAAAGAEGLEEGTKSAAEGAQELAAGTKSAAAGAKELADGTKSAAEGAKEVEAGSKALEAGVNELNNKSGELACGMDHLAAGVKDYTNGVSSLADGSKNLKDGADSLRSNAEMLAGSLAQISNMMDQMVNSGGTVSAAESYGAAANALAAANNTLAGAGAGSGECVVTGTSEAAAAIAGMVEGVDAAQIQAVIDGYVGAVPVGRSDASAQIAYAMAEITEAQNSLYAAQNAEADVQAAVRTKEEQLKQLAAGLQSASAGAAALTKGAEELSNGIGAVSAGADQLAGRSKELTGGVDQLAAGVPGLTAGVGELAQGASRLSKGAGALSAGNQELAAGAGALLAGNQQLLTGAGTLAAGNQKLAEGAGALAAGSRKLSQGAAALSAGSQELAAGAGALADGNLQLAKGMAEFKSSGIDKLADVFDQDIRTVRARIDTMSELGKNYKSFAGIKEGMDGSTKFIIETEGVK